MDSGGQSDACGLAHSMRYVADSSPLVGAPGKTLREHADWLPSADGPPGAVSERDILGQLAFTMHT